MTKQEKIKLEAQAKLREFLRPGDAVYVSTVHCSRSGMQRLMRVFVMEHNAPRDITNLASKAMDGKEASMREGWGYDVIKMQGCGMDMQFALVYGLSYALFHDAFVCIGDACPANDHNNAPYPPRVLGSMHHSDGGYALVKRSL